MKFEYKFDVLNVIKILSFLSVFFLHSVIFSPLNFSNDKVNFLWVLFTPAWSGVWVFYILSGFGIGYGFANGKYVLSKLGILQYFFQRLSKLVPMYFVFICAALLFFTPDRLTPTSENLKNILRLFFFQYDESFGSLDFGAVWFLSTLFKLYLLAPIAYFLCRPFLITTNRTIALISLVMLTGLVFRLGWFYHFKVTNVDEWSPQVYKPYYMNLDLFLSGFFLNWVKPRSYRLIRLKIYRAAPLLFFITLLMINSYMYFQGAYRGRVWDMFVYQYVFPSLYIVSVLYCIYVYNICGYYNPYNGNLLSIRRNPIRLLDFFSVIMLPCYLLHSAVLRQIHPAIAKMNYGPPDLFIKLFGGSVDLATNFCNHIFSTFYSLFLTVLASIIIVAFVKSPDLSKIAVWIDSNFNLRVLNRSKQ